MNIKNDKIKITIRRFVGNDLRNYTHAVDLYSILHFPIQFYVHTLFCIWYFTSSKWLVLFSAYQQQSQKR